MAWQGMHALFERKWLQLYTDNEKSKINTNLNTVPITLLHLAIIVWHILSIGTLSIATYYYYYCKQKNAVSQPFIANFFKNVIFNI